MTRGSFRLLMATRYRDRRIVTIEISDDSCFNYVCINWRICSEYVLANKECSFAQV